MFKLLVATFFLASCVAIERNNPDDLGSPNYIEPSSSSMKVSSSSSKPSSSSIQTGIIEGDPVEYKGETYKTVIIANKTWMARNLNYNVSGSKCYDNKPANCTTYGKLYDWNMAMTACTDGWRLPSGEDWNALMKFLNPSCKDYEDCNKAGTKLKATSGWKATSGIPPGTNIFGFTALPGGGNNDSQNTFFNIEECGNWWSSAEQSKNNAYVLFMCSFNESVKWDYSSKSINFYSVRCVKD